MTSSWEAASTVATALGGTRKRQYSDDFELELEGQRVTYAFRFDTTSGFGNSRVRLTWSEITVPLRRYPLSLSFRGRGKKLSYEAAPLALADVVLDQPTRSVLRESFDRFRLTITAANAKPGRRYVKLCFVGWFLAPETARAAMRLVVSLAARIPRAVVDAQQAGENIVAAGAPFRDSIEVASRRDVIAEMFAEIADLRRRKLKGVLTRVIIYTAVGLAIVLVNALVT